MAAYDQDVREELDRAVQAMQYIFAKEAGAQHEAIGNNTCFVTDWVSENLPLETKDMNALTDLVRTTAKDTSYADEVLKSVKEPVEKEDVLVFCDQRGYCQKLFEKVPEKWIGTRKMVTKPAKLITKDEIESHIGSKTWDLIIFGCGLDMAKSGSVQDVIDKEAEVIEFALALCQVLFRKEGCCNRIAFLSHDIFQEDPEVLKTRGMAYLSGAGLNGYCNTLRSEVEFPVALVDIESTEDKEIIPYVVTELFRKTTFGANNVRLCHPYAIRDGMKTKKPTGRYVWRQYLSAKYEEAGCDFLADFIDKKGIIAISGGNGALALVMGEWFLKKAGEKVAASGGSWKPQWELQFLSRSCKVSDLNMPRWKDIEKMGSELGVPVAQMRLDMSTPEAVSNFVQSMNGQLLGFIHSAGVLQDSMIPNQTVEKFNAVFDSKHRPALWLHDALEKHSNPKLSFLWVFSSVAVNGSMGQLNYSTSNAALDAISRYRKAMGKPALAIQWGAWGEVGMAAQLDEPMRRRVMMGPMPYFTIAQGCGGMECGLRTGLPVISVFIESPAMMFGWLQNPDPKGVWNRMFMGEYTATAYMFGGEFNRDNAYLWYRLFRYIFQPMTESESLCWDTYIAPKMIEDKKEVEEPLVVGKCF